jgi:transcriptional regulator, BadM/Rrf2 family
VLIRNNIAVSREGVGGGVRLAGDPRSINVADVVRMMQGDITLSECMFRKKMCANRPRCLLRRKIMAIEEKVNREFERISIADLMSEKAG